MTRSRKVVACVPRLLPRQEWPNAARNAITVNPDNRPPDLDESTLRLGGEGERLALDVTRYWGYWSNLGTDILLITRGRPTMNLEAFTMTTPDAEFFRVVRHEGGHTLGFPHEHIRKAIIDRLDREKVIADFMTTQGWTRQEV